MLIIFTFQAAKRNANYSSEGSYLSRILIRMSSCKMKPNEKFKFLDPWPTYLRAKYYSRIHQSPCKKGKTFFADVEKVNLELSEHNTALSGRKSHTYAYKMSTGIMTNLEKVNWPSRKDTFPLYLCWWLVISVITIWETEGEWRAHSLCLAKGVGIISAGALTHGHCHYVNISPIQCH